MLEFIHKGKSQADARDACHQVGRPHFWRQCYLDSDNSVVSISGKIENTKAFHKEQQHKQALCCDLCGSVYIDKKLLPFRNRVYISVGISNSD